MTGAQDDGNDAAARSGTSPYRRRNCVLIRPAEPTESVHFDRNGGFQSAVNDVMGQLDTHQQLEMWVFPNNDGELLTLLNPPSDASNPSPATHQTTLTDLERVPDKEKRSHSESDLQVDRVADKVNAHIGHVAEIRTCDVDLSQVGQQPLMTSRLVGKKNNMPVHPDKLTSLPVLKMLSSLSQQGVPFIYQVILEKKGQDNYNISVRLVVYDLAAAVPQTTDVYRIADQSYQYDLHQWYKYANLTSNQQFPLCDYYNYNYSDLTDRSFATTRGYADASDRTKAKTMVKGTNEYTNLLNGNINSDELYRKKLGYPKFKVYPHHVDHFVSLCSYASGSNVWGEVTGRGAPLIVNTGPLLSDPDGSVEPIGMTEVDDSDIGDVETEGGDEHERLVREGIEHLEKLGFDLYKVQQTTGSIPDGCGWDASGGRVFFEAEYSGESKPANYLNNIARAMQTDIDVHIYVPDSGVADSIAKNLRVPYNELTRDGALLYTQSSSVTLEEGGTPLLPKGTTEAHWFITNEHELLLRADDAVVAEGAIDRSVATYDYELPVSRNKNGMQVVEGPNGRELGRYATKNQLTEEWTPVSPPHVPREIVYSGQPTIWYETAGQLEMYDDEPEWAVEQDSLRYKRFGKYAAEHLVVEAPRPGLSKHELYTGLCEVYKTQTNKKVPNKSWFFQAGGDPFGVEEEGDPLDPLNWVTPLQCDPPDHPKADDETLDSLFDV